MTDWKALCAELVEASKMADWEEWGEVWARAEAALAEPEPQGPTDEELWEAYDQMDGVPEDWAWVRDYARAVLAHWGHHTRGTR